MCKREREKRERELFASYVGVISSCTDSQCDHISSFVISHNGLFARCVSHKGKTVIQHKVTAFFACGKRGFL